MCYIDGKPISDSDPVHGQRDILRCKNTSGAYLSIMVRFTRCMTCDLEDFCQFFLIHIRNLESVFSTHDGKYQSDIDYREVLKLKSSSSAKSLRFIQRRNRQVMTYDNKFGVINNVVL